ncbi:Uncharacterised protein [Citrobacter freundii]|nr:Uncharacterised protein [Citrobacter freundii]
MPAVHQQVYVLCSLTIRNHYHESALAELSGGGLLINEICLLTPLKHYHFQ